MKVITKRKIFNTNLYQRFFNLVVLTNLLLLTCHNTHEVE